MKKDYMKPQMEVVDIQQQDMVCASPGASSLTTDETLQMPDDGYLDDEDDDV